MGKNPKLVIRLRDDRVLVKRDPVKDKTESGLLYLPPANGEERRSKDAKGVIFALGCQCNVDEDGKPLEKTHADYLKVGDHVTFGEYSGQDFIWEEEGFKEDEFLIMRQDDISAVLPR